MGQKFKQISIVIPVYNEKNTIDQVINSVINANTLGLKKEIIVVDDCSTDGTKDLLKYKVKNSDIKVFYNNKNRGKGAVIREGILKSSGDVVLVQDADLEYTPNDYPVLIKPILEGYADVVYGSRFLNSHPHRVLYFYHYLGNKIITTLSNVCTNLNLSDMETGYKIFKGELIRKIALKLKSDRFGFEPEITCRIAKTKGIRIYEVGISYFGRTYEEGKKIKAIDGFKAIIEIIRFSFID